MLIKAFGIEKNNRGHLLFILIRIEILIVYLWLWSTASGWFLCLPCFIGLNLTQAAKKLRSERRLSVVKSVITWIFCSLSQIRCNEQKRIKKNGCVLGYQGKKKSWEVRKRERKRPTEIGEIEGRVLGENCGWDSNYNLYKKKKMYAYSDINLIKLVINLKTVLTKNRLFNIVYIIFVTLKL